MDAARSQGTTSDERPVTPAPAPAAQPGDRAGSLRTLIDGAIAGAVATWAMGKATSYLYDRESEAARQREDDARGGETAYGVAAEKVADMAGVSLSDDERKAAGTSIHWALGVAAGVAYSALRRDDSGLSPLRGVGFGTLFWAVMDETVTPALGLTPGPEAFPLQTHARGLAGHLVFGTCADATLALLDRAR